MKKKRVSTFPIYVWLVLCKDGVVHAFKKSAKGANMWAVTYDRNWPPKWRPSGPYKCGPHKVIAGKIVENK